MRIDRVVESDRDEVICMEGEESEERVDRLLKLYDPGFARLRKAVWPWDGLSSTC